MDQENVPPKELCSPGDGLRGFVFAAALTQAGIKLPLRLSERATFFDQKGHEERGGLPSSGPDQPSLTFSL